MKNVLRIFFALLIVTSLCAQKRIPKMKMGIVFYYKPSDSFVRDIKTKIHDIYGAKKIDVLEQDTVPDSTVMVTNVDYVSYGFLSRLAKKVSKKHNHIVGITDRSLVSTVGFIAFNRVYGQTENSVCIASDYLISKEGLNYKDTLFNVILHEIGHLYGLPHCENSKCIMVQYGGLDNTLLCENCKGRLEVLKRYGHISGRGRPKSINWGL